MFVPPGSSVLFAVAMKLAAGRFSLLSNSEDVDVDVDSEVSLFSCSNNACCPTNPNLVVHVFL